jgi:hypothetical protein
LNYRNYNAEDNGILFGIGDQVADLNELNQLATERNKILSKHRYTQLSKRESLATIPK